MLNNRFLNISIKTWLMIFVTILYLIFKKNQKNLLNLKINVPVLMNDLSENIS